jgi:hypothetical protein
MYDGTATTTDAAGQACGARSPRNDLGSTMLVVMGAAAVLFVIAAAVVGVVVFQQTQQVRAQAAVRATSLAEQGMEVYLSALRTDPDYWVTTPTIAGKAQDGTWTVVANIASSTITAVGHDRLSGQLHVIRSEARPESYADYTMVTGGDVTLGRGTPGVTVSGSVRSNEGVDLEQTFPGVTVYSATPAAVVNPQNASGGVQRISALDFSQIDSVFPNLYTASWQRTPWATGASLPQEAADLVKPMTFYRDASNPSRSSWGVPTQSDPSINATDLVGVGVDFSNETPAEKALGVFYIRSMWTPNNIYAAVTPAEKASIGREEFIDFARQDPTWNINGWASPDLAGRPKSITARALDPRGTNVIYVGGDLDVYVTAKDISRSVTIVSERDIYIIGPIERAVGSTATVGLVAKHNIYICSAMPQSTDPNVSYETRTGDTSVLSGESYTRGVKSGAQASYGKAAGETMPNNVTIQASMLAVSGAIIMDPENPTQLPDEFKQEVGVPKRNTLTITGSLIARDGIRGANFVGADSSFGGFSKTVIGPERTTGTTPPPLFPQTGSGALKVTRWDEYSTNTDPNDPALTGLAIPDPDSYGIDTPAIGKDVFVKVVPVGGDTVKPMTTSNAMPSYNGQAVITLTASDASNLAVGTIWHTWYRIDGGVETTYTNEIVIPPLADNTVATRTVEYYSKDQAGNVESPRTDAFVMRGRDTLPPYTIVRDSNNPGKALDYNYPQIGDPEYVVWGDFVPQFTSTEVPSGSGVNQIWVSMNTNGVQTFANDWTGSQTPLNFAPVQAPAVGSVELKYSFFAYDKSGNREELRTLTLTQRALDTFGPLMTDDAAQLFAGDAVIHLQADDGPAGQGVSSIRYSLDNGDWVTTQSVTATRSMAFGVTVAAPTDPDAAPVPHTLTYVGTDAATDRFHLPSPNSTPVTISFLVGPGTAPDTTQPQSSSDAQSSYVGPASINLSAEDTGGIAAMYWQLDGGDVQTGSTVYVDSPLSDPVVHTLAFWARDKAGNVETPAKTVTFTSYHEIVPPTTTAFNQDLYNTPLAVFQLIAQDNDGGSGLKATYYSIDGGAAVQGVATLLGLTWVTVQGEGPHHVDFWSVDRAGNLEPTKHIDFLTDTTPPITQASVLTTTYVGQAIIPLAATDTVAGVTGSGVSYTHWRNTADGNEQITNPVLVGPGTWDIDYWSVDKAGNAETPKRMHVTVVSGPDTYAPRSYDDIKPYYKAGSNPAEIHLFSWDVQTGIQTMWYRLDGAAAKALTGVGIPPASYLVTATGDQTHTIEYWAQDKATPSNVETPHQSKSFMIDTAFPVTTCDATSGATYWKSKSFTLQASDSGSGIKATYYVLDNGMTVKGTSVSVPAPLKGYAAQHVIQYWSEDKAGNVESPKSVSFTSYPPDTIAPRTYSNAKPTYAGSGIISLFPSDNVGGSGVAATYYILDGGAAKTGTVLLATGSGAHTLEFWSVDKAGNEELPHQTALFLVDYFGPTTVCDAKRWYNGSPATVHLTAQAVGGRANPSNTFYRLDGGSITTGTLPTTSVQVTRDGDHVLDYWSTDGFGNVEPTKTVQVGIDLWAPVTTSNAGGSYAGNANFTLTASDQPGRSGVKATYWRLSTDTTAQTGVSVHVQGPADLSTVSRSVVFWSEDYAGNIEAVHTVNFTIGPDAGMSFSGMVPTENVTIPVRETTVGVSATSTSSVITTATGMLDGVPMPVTCSITSTTTGGGTAAPFTLTGGGVAYTSGSNTVVVFRSSGSITIPGSIATASVLVVGGGGGGGARHGGGGGAGQYVTGTKTNLTGTMNIVVGDGGGGASGTSNAAPNYTSDTAQSGLASTGFGLTAAGGKPGVSGAAGASGQGLAGGTGYYVNPTWHGAGGGGSASAGGNATASSLGVGGAGTSNAISGSSVVYAAGGAGGGYYENTVAASVAPNTGNGGNASGGESNLSGNGGSGVVIVSFPTPAPPTFSAVGGVKTTKIVGGVSYDVITFTGSGSLLCYGTMPGATVLTVGGGGGGAGNLSGGGGGGGVRTDTVTLAGTMPVVVGGGGVSDSGYMGWVDDGNCGTVEGWISGPATNGDPSSFGGLTALGGGSGAQRDLYSYAGGGAGVVGSGGGGATYTNNIGGLGTPGQGFKGGNGTLNGMSEAAGGGGGGAAQVGGNGIGGAVLWNGLGTGGKGGDGLASSISGSTAYYGGGGGGGSYWTSGLGGLGGGGKGEPGATAGTPNTGGGGGAGANGGSGVVIITYPTPVTGPTVTTTVANAWFLAKNLLDGAHFASFTFTDASGKKSTKSWTFFVGAPADTKAPVTSSDVTSTALYTTGFGASWTGWYNSSATIHLSAADEAGGTGVASTSYKVDGGAVQAGQPPTTTVVVSGEGTHTLEFWSTDRAGNEETPHKTVNVAIDVTPPSTTTDALTAYKGFANVTLAASDTAGSGVKKTYYTVDGAGVSTFSVTGGVKTFVGNRTVITFTSSGSLVCSGSLTGADVLVVAGGGGGMTWAGGGGGGGGVVTGTANLSGTIAVTVGSGGSAGAWSTSGAQYLPTRGSNSAFGSLLTAIGGGSGGSRDINPGVATAGGSGGGGGGSYYSGNWPGAQGTAGPPRQGYAGGNGTGSAGDLAGNSAGGGGGGAGGVGGVGTSLTPGIGGIGLSSSISGSAVTYGGGGGGSCWSIGAAGGLGGGGRGGDPGGSAGAANTGGGGGASPAGSGGSGIVIISFPTPTGVALEGTSVVVPGPLSGNPVSHTISYWSQDNVGNVETSKTVSFTISADDKTPPQTTCNASAIYNATSTITLTATDAGSGVDYTKYRLTKDGAPGILTTGTVLSSGGQGSYVLEFWSIDKMGNRESTQTVKYVVDQTAPNTSSDAAPTIVVTPVVVQADPAASSSKTFGDSGTYAFTVPAGVTNLTVDLAGAAGGEGEDGGGSGGDSVHVNIPVTPGWVLTLDNGSMGAGLDDGNGGWGYHSGGDSGTSHAGGGGGSSAILHGTTVLAEAAGGNGGTGWSGTRWGAGGGSSSSSVGVATVAAGANGGDGRTQISWLSSQTFGFTGANQTFTVPAGVTAVTVDLYGAQGGDGYQGYVGGAGGYVHATIPVTAGQTLTVRVGGTGGDGPGGWPNGGYAGHAGGGGGSTSILAGSSVWVEAGAGGGGSCDDGDGYPGGYQGSLPGGNSWGGNGDGSGGGGGWNGGAGMISSHGADPGDGGSSYIAVGSGSLEEGVNGGGNGSAKISWTAGAAQTTLQGGWTTIHLTAADTHLGTSGVRNTYWTLDGGAQTTGNTIAVQGPASGSAVHHIRFWSDDNALNAETPAKEATFTLKAESAPMVWSGETPTPLSTVNVRNPVVSVTGAGDEAIVAASATLDGVAMTPPNLTLTDMAGSTKRMAQFSTSRLSDGVHTVAFTFTVAGGREAVHVPWTFTVAGPDIVPPVTTSDAKTSYVGTATVTLAATDASPGVKATYYKLDGAQSTGTVITVVPPVWGAAVLHTINYWSVDGFDNVEATHTATFTVAPAVDTTPPTTWTDLQPVYEGPAVIRLWAQDNPGGWGVANTYYRLDGGATTAFSIAAPINVDPPSSASATHTLEYWSVDRAGISEAHTIASFRINSLADFTPPITTIDYQTYYTNTSSTIKLTATDNKYGSGVDYTMYRQTKNNGTPGVLTSGTVIPIGGEGKYRLDFWSIDKAHNQEATKSVDYWVDLTPPVSSAAASSTYTGPASVTITATDGDYGSGVYYTQYLLDDTLPWVTGNTVYVADPITGSQTHHIDYRSRDWAGNWETAKTVTFTVNAMPANVQFSEWTPAKLLVYGARNPVVSVRGKAATNIIAVTATLDGTAYTPTRYYNGGGQTDCTALFNTSNLSDTTHTVSFTYTIASGAKVSETWSFSILGPDNVPPVTGHDVQPAYEGTATIHLTPVDYFPAGVPSGVKATYYQLDGDIQRSGTLITVAPPVSGTAARSITFWSVDNLNNTESRTTVPFNISASRDTTPPTTTSNVASPYTGTANITLTASDNPGGWGLNYTDYRVSMLSPTPSAGTTQTTKTATTVIPTIAGPKTGSATYRLYFRSVDLAGNPEATKWVDFTVNAATDITPPVTGISASPRYSGPGYIYLYPSDAGQGVQYTHYILTGGTSDGVETSGTTVKTGSQGSYTLKYWSKDWAGNQEATNTYTYVVDQTPPTTTSTVLATYTVSATILLTAKDDHVGASGVSYTSYSIDNGATRTNMNYGIDPYVSSVTVPRWYTSGAPEVHQVKFWSTDKVGWSEAAKTVTFTINATTDSTPPNTTTDRKPFYGAPSIITLTAADSGWGVAYTNYRLDSGPTMIGTLAGSGGSGSHTLYYWSTDNAGNVETTKSTTFTIDTVAPVTSIVATATTYSGSASISLVATDPAPGSGVASTNYRVDDGTQYTGTSIYVPGPVSGTATHHIDFWSVDAVNNSEAYRTATFTVTAVADITPPALTDDHAVTYAKPGTINLTATDAGWGVASIKYQLDGGSIVSGYTAPAAGVRSASCSLATGGGTPAPHTLKYWAADQNGNTTTTTITYTVTRDTTPPTTSSNRQPLYTTGPAAISLTAVDTGWGVQYTHYRLNGGAETSGTYIVVPDPLTGSTDSTLTFWSRDWADNAEAAQTVTFTVRAVPATMVFSGITPADGSNIGTTTASISISASSNQAIVSAVMKIDGSVRALSSFTHSGVGATAMANVTGIASGLRTVEVTFTGADGRQNTKAWTFTCTPRTDFIAPITVSDVKASYFGTATITLTPGDEAGGSGVDYIRYKVDSGAWTTGTLPVTTIVTTPPSSGAPVSHTISYWSADKATNAEGMNTKTYTVAPVDLTAPVTGSTAKRYYNAPGTILLLPSDVNGSGVAATYYMLDNDTTGTIGTMLGSGGTGSHRLTYWSIDNAGNVEKPNVFDYIVDVDAPLTSSDAASEYSGTATIKLNAQDVGGSGIKDTFYRLDYGVDGGAPISGTVIDVAPPVSGSVVHTIYYWSVDNAGNVETEHAATFNVKAAPDKTPPITSIDFRKTYAVPGLITLSAVDYPIQGGWGVASTHYILDSNAEQLGLILNTGGMGTHTLRYWSVDKGDNYESVETTTYVVTAEDNQPPRTTASVSENQQYIGSAAISLTATDNSGFASVTYHRLDAGDPVVGTSVTVPGPASGTQAHTLTFWSVDINGKVEDNTAASNTVHFTVKTLYTPMIFSGMLPAPGSTIAMRNPSITLTATGQNPMAGATLTLDGVARTPQVALNGTSATLTYQANYLASDSQHTVSASFSDTSGGVETTSWSFRVVAPADVTVPVSSSNTTSFYKAPATIKIFSGDEAGGSGVDQVYYILDNGSPVAGVTPTTSISVATAGPHSLEYWAIDAAGNRELPHHLVGFNVDMTAPQTTSDAILAYSGTAVINLTANDFAAGSGIAGTHYTVDRGFEQSGTVITVPAPSTGNQWHEISFWSFDRAGNVETSQTISLNVWFDPAAPAFTSMAPAALSVDDVTPPTTVSDALATYSGTGEIRLAATDDAGGVGVAHTYYRWDGGPQTESTIIGVSGVGIHQVAFWSVDAAGNAETPVTVTFQVTEPDITAPVTTSDAVTSYAGTATVTFTAVDGAGGVGVRGTYYRLDSGPAQQGAAVQIAPPVSGSAQHTVTFWSVDNVGNTEPEKSVTFAVLPAPDTVAPTTASDAMASYAGTATITLSPTDDLGGSGVACTYFRVDYGPQQAGTAIVVPAPLEGTVAHHVDFWSVDVVGNVEAERRSDFVMTPAGPLAYLSFVWGGSGTVSLHVENALGYRIASTVLSGSGAAVTWQVPVQAGGWYRVVCDSWQDVVTLRSGSAAVYTPVLTTGQTYAWSF